MFYLKVFAYFVLIGAIYAETELSEEEKKALEGIVECGKKWNMTKEDFDNTDQWVNDPTEKMLCFMKCSAEKDGTLDEAGNVKNENIDKILTLMKVKSDDQKGIKDCIGKVSQVKTCADFKNIAKCMPSA